MDKNVRKDYSYYAQCTNEIGDNTLQDQIEYKRDMSKLTFECRETDPIDLLYIKLTTYRSIDR